MKSLDKILEEAANLFHVSVEEIKSQTRIKEIVIARAYYAKMALLEGYHPAAISKPINRDRSTIYNLEKIDVLERSKFISKKRKRELRKEVKEIKSVYEEWGGLYSQNGIDTSDRDKGVFDYVFDQN